MLNLYYANNIKYFEVINVFLSIKTKIKDMSNYLQLIMNNIMCMYSI